MRHRFERNAYSEKHEREAVALVSSFPEQLPRFAFVPDYTQALIVAIGQVCLPPSIALDLWSTITPGIYLL